MVLWGFICNCTLSGCYNAGLTCSYNFQPVLDATLLEFSNNFQHLRHSRSEGKSPPESHALIRASGSFQHLGHMCTSPTEQNIIHAWRVRPMSHMNMWPGEFTKKLFCDRERISCHTGTVDAAWSAINRNILNHLSGQSHSKTRIPPKIGVHFWLPFSDFNAKNVCLPQHKPGFQQLMLVWALFLARWDVCVCVCARACGCVVCVCVCETSE